MQGHHSCIKTKSYLSIHTYLCTHGLYKAVCLQNSEEKVEPIFHVSKDTIKV